MFGQLDCFWKNYKAVKRELHDLMQEESNLLQKKESLKVNLFFPLCSRNIFQ
jgi:hypothetical protein